MARKSMFNDGQKDFIVDSITKKWQTVTQLANHFECHPRTIHRVLEEKGMVTPTTQARSKGVGDTIRLKKVLAQANVTVDQCSQLLMVVMAYGLTDPDRLKAAIRDGNTASMAVLAPAAQRKAQTAALFQPGAQPSLKASNGAALPA